MEYYFNGAKILAPLSIISNEPMFDVDTISLKKQRATQNAQRWEMSFETINEKGTAGSMFADTVAAFDAVGNMVMPQFKEVYEATTVNTNPKVASTTTIGTSSVTLKTAATTGVIPKGSFIKFSNHDKVYITLAALNFDTGSNPTISIYPTLARALAVDDTMNVLSDCTFTYYRDISNVQGITFRDGILSNLGTISLIEAL